MRLDWQPASFGDGPPISTSITPDETRELRKLAKGAQVLEVGAAYGYSTVVMGQVAKRVISVDPHQQLASLGALLANLTAYGVEDRVDPRIAASQAILPTLKPGSFDLIFIDGDHWSGAVEHDIAWAQRLVKPGGHVVVHDYGEDSCPGVAPVVDRLLPDGRLVVDTLWVWQRPADARGKA